VIVAGATLSCGEVAEGAVEAPSDWPGPKEPVTGYTVKRATSPRARGSGAASPPGVEPGQAERGGGTRDTSA